ncbi:MAG: acyltransferase family protein [Myxococcales bacterium]|nr:acyltransferase family protein [Myxococcales bacterium]
MRPVASPSEYRAEVDGLRGVAIALVVAFHGWPRLLPGGFVGVDVFFVLSGFVVTGVVARERAAGGFEPRRFLMRRVNRLAPALLLVLASTLVASTMLLSTSLFSSVARHAAAALGLVANLVQASESSYFDASVGAQPLHHLWSLSVEEQVYLFVAVILVMTGRRRLDWVLTGIGGVSIVAWLVMTNWLPTWAWFVSPTRAWEFLLGVGAWNRATGGTAQTAKMSFLGLAMVLLSASLFETNESVAGWWITSPAVGTALVLSAPRGSAITKLLSFRPLTALGLISYPLYLWHWPLLTMGRLAAPVASHGTVAVVAVLGSVGLAVLTTLVIEPPFRARPSSRKTAGLLVACGLGCLGAWQLHRAPELWVTRAPIEAEIERFVAQDVTCADARVGGCWVDAANALPAEECVERTPERLPLVAVLGDSHGARLAAGVRALQLERKDFRLAQLNRSLCPTLLGVGNAECRAHNADAFARLVAARPAVVIIHIRWTVYNYWRTTLAETLAALTSSLPGTMLVVVGPVPEWRVSLPYTLSRRAGGASVPERLVPEILPELRKLERELSATAIAGGARYVSSLDALCTVDGACLVRMSNDPLILSTPDAGHLTTAASRLVAERALQATVWR